MIKKSLLALCTIFVTLALLFCAGCTNTVENTQAADADETAVNVTFTPAVAATATPSPAPTATPTVTPTATPTATPQPTPTPGKTAAADSNDDKSENNEEIVYITPYGKKYHRKSCGTIKNSDLTAITVSRAEAYGYTACKDCKP